MAISSLFLQICPFVNIWCLWRKGSRLILFYKDLNGQANIPVDDLKTPLRHTRNHHSEPFQVPYARTDAYRHSFFPETIRDWNALPASTVSSAECSEGCNYKLPIKFQILVNLRALFDKNILPIDNILKES